MDKDRHIDIMGIVNLTPDSYFTQSRCTDVCGVLDRVSQMVSQGASIVDFGACSSRPGSVPVGADQEWKRLGPALEAVRDAFPGLTISVDTCWSSVVERAYQAVGPFIVNDISASEADPSMLSVAGRLGLRYVAMHMRGTSENMQTLADYDDVTESVMAYFREFSRKAEENGVNDWILDPGFGFAKTLEQNYELLKNLKRFKEIKKGDGLCPPLLVGVSRKSMIYKPLGIGPEEALAATQVAHLAALQNGADILRVHDVAEASHTVSLWKLMA